jgi:hypothetical protein
VTSTSTLQIDQSRQSTLSPASTSLIRVINNCIHFDLHQPLRIDEARHLHHGIHRSNVFEDFAVNPLSISTADELRSASSTVDADTLRYIMTLLQELPSHAKPPSRKEESQVFCIESSTIRCNTLRILSGFAPLRATLGFLQCSHIMFPKSIDRGEAIAQSDPRFPVLSFSENQSRVD